MCKHIVKAIGVFGLVIGLSLFQTVFAGKREPTKKCAMGQTCSLFPEYFVAVRVTEKGDYQCVLHQTSDPKGGDDILEFMEVDFGLELSSWIWGWGEDLIFIDGFKWGGKKHPEMTLSIPSTITSGAGFLYFALDNGTSGTYKKNFYRQFNFHYTWDGLSDLSVRCTKV